MVPAPNGLSNHDRPPADRSALPRWMRGALVAVAGAWVALFVIAARLNPYDGAGGPLRMEAHMQLGLPPCNFYVWTGKPCPSCGMTTSFALLAHGDLANSIRANAVGTLLAVCGVGLIPWCMASAARGKYLLVRSAELWLLGAIIGFVVLALVRWAIVMGLDWMG